MLGSGLFRPFDGRMNPVYQGSLLPPTDDRPTRRRTLVGALGLFAENGYDGASMRDIASVVGVRPATLYDQFPSKAHILARLCVIGCQAWHDLMVEAMVDAGDDHLAMVANTVRANILGRCYFPELSRTVDENLTRLEPELASPALELKNDVERRGVDAVLRAIDTGDFDVPNPVSALYAISGMVQRIPYWFEATKSYDVDDLVADFTLYAFRLFGYTGDPEATASLVRGHATR